MKNRRLKFLNFIKQNDRWKLFELFESIIITLYKYKVYKYYI